MKRIVAIAFLILMLTGVSFAEEYDCWVLCNPESCVNIRRLSARNSPEIAWAVSGSQLKTDQKERNGFLHVIDLSAEETEGWISSNYIVWDEPEEINQVMTVRSNGRVAVRKWIQGKIIKWVNDGDELTVYLKSGEWAVTEYGYIMSEYLNMPD